MLLQVRATMVAGQAVTRGEAVSLSRGAQQSGTGAVNYRSCELFLDCDIYM